MAGGNACPTAGGQAIALLAGWPVLAIHLTDQAVELIGDFDEVLLGAAAEFCALQVQLDNDLAVLA